MKNTAKIASPCIQLCAVSGKTGFCIGCGRNLSEIGNWSGFSDKQKADVIAKLPQRLENNKKILG
jgi:predicted Fe-S protein YdhL (DUF1289 family)